MTPSKNFDDWYMAVLQKNLNEIGALRPTALATCWNAALDALLEELPPGTREIVAQEADSVRVKPYNVRVAP